MKIAVTGKGGVDEAANKQDEMVQKLGAVQATDIDDGDLEW